MVLFLKRYGGYFAVVLSACFFALVATLTKIAYGLGMNPLQVLTVQAALASAILLFYGLLFSPGSLRIGKRNLPRLVLQALIGSLGTSALFSYALLYLPATLSTMLLFMYPVLVTLGAFIFLHQKVTTNHLLAVALAIGGTMLSTQFWRLGPGSLSLKGVILGLGSALAYSFFILYGENILSSLEPLATLTYVQVFSTIGLVLYQLFVNNEVGFAINFAQFLIGIALATAASIVPFGLLLVGIKLIGATKASVIGTIELPVAFVFAFLFLGERFSASQAAGAVLITASVLLLRVGELDKTGVKPESHT